MTRYKQIDLSKVKTKSITERKSKVTVEQFGKVYEPSSDPFAIFLNSLPSILVAEDFKNVIDEIVSARKNSLPVIVLMGAHVIKVGCAPIINDLIRKKVITAVAMNSAAAIHDVETALWGVTSEDVAENLLDGKFGMWKETGDFINSSLTNANKGTDEGYGETLARKLCESNTSFKQYSILIAAYEANIPITVHASIGTDIVHQQPTMDGAATGEMTFRDFKVFCNVVSELEAGGVVLNFGSAVILPEVFLKALTVVRNLGYKAKIFTTVNFDMIQHYRQRVNVVERPTQDGGKGFMITGHHEIMIPLLAAALKSKMQKDDRPAK